MDVEIDDRDALGAVDRLRVACGDGGVVEEAEAHRGRDFGVMTRRARGDEGVADLAAHHFVDREDGAAGRAQRGLERAGRHRGVLVDGRQPLLRRRRADRLDIVERMNAFDGGEVGARRGVARQHLKVSLSKARSTARKRSGRSGWPSPMSCARHAGWLMTSVVKGLILIDEMRLPPLREFEVSRRREGKSIRHSRQAGVSSAGPNIVLTTTFATRTRRAQAARDKARGAEGGARANPTRDLKPTP